MEALTLAKWWDQRLNLVNLEVESILVRPPLTSLFGIDFPNAPAPKFEISSQD